MILAVAATEMELTPFRRAMSGWRGECETLVSGVGPVESAVRLSRVLAGRAAEVQLVLHFGIGGAYRREHLPSVPMLGVCLATREVLGDLGIAFADRVEPLPPTLCPPAVYELAEQPRRRAGEILSQAGVAWQEGSFITVAGVSGTARRGDDLCRRWQGLCENMEGGGIARACQEYGVPLVELRVISNYVEDRNEACWQVAAACQQAGKLAAMVARALG